MRDILRAFLAQSVERAAFNRKVVGSRPTGGVFYIIKMLFTPYVYYVFLLFSLFIYPIFFITYYFHCWLVCSNLKAFLIFYFLLKRASPGIEPGPPAPKAGILPLNYKACLYYTYVTLSLYRDDYVFLIFLLCVTCFFTLFYLLPFSIFLFIWYSLRGFNAGCGKNLHRIKLRKQ